MAAQITTFVYIIVGIGAIVGSGYVGKKTQKVATDLLAVYKSRDMEISGEATDVQKTRISGIAQIYEDTVMSPLKAQESIAYSSEIQDTTGAVKSKIFEQDDSVPFLLVEGNNRMLVDPRNAELYLQKDIVPFDRESVQSIISQKVAGQIPATSLGVEEGNIKPGDSVFIYGDIDYYDDEEFGRSISSTKSGKVVLSNMNASKVRNHLIKMTTIYSVGTILMFLAGLIILGMGIQFF